MQVEQAQHPSLANVLGPAITNIQAAEANISTGDTGTGDTGTGSSTGGDGSQGQGSGSGSGCSAGPCPPSVDEDVFTIVDLLLLGQNDPQLWLYLPELIQKLYADLNYVPPAQNCPGGFTLGPGPNGQCIEMA